ncbi:MAG TPA: hypothetical protein VMG80_03705, partial [Solirubrobacteraceae bacterium]|nr:hypothetical protein [Solirubrobacteraceae bacterium]
YERQQAGAPWQATPTPLPGEAGQLALFREGGSLRAIVTGGGVANIAVASPPPPGSPPDLYPPLGEQSPGVTNSPVLRQTAEGWSDESHELDPVEQPAGGYASQDLPYRPDSIFAMLVDPGGAAGWAVGGDQGSREGLQTGDIERYPAGGSAPVGEGEVSVPLQTPGEQEAKEPAPATFAIGGHAECVAPCAARERAGVGPQVWLSAALALARKADARAFLYTGPSVTEGKVEGARVHPLPFAREFERTASILAPDPSFAPALVAAAPQDLDARSEGGGTEALFAGALSAELGEPVPGACVAEVNCHYYTMESTGTEGSVRVIVLDESSEVSQTQIGWLATELANAKSAGEPAIVVGSADLNAEIAANLAVAKTIAGTLEAGEASAYFYDSPEKNVHESLRWGGERVPTFGTGTLGYEQIYNQERSDFHGAGGILLAQLHLSARVAGSNRVPVSVRLIPVIGELALEAKDGILLRRSEPALFEGLARRPRAGSHANINSDEALEDPYVRIPSNCVGQECAVGLFPEYTFSSSNPEVGQFVEPNLAAAENLHAVRLGSNGKPIPDAESGLFCAYNPGTTTVTISAGGLSSSQPVTVQPGSVRQPCGTVPIKPRSAASAGTTVPVPPPSPAPAPNGSPPAGVAPVVPVPPPPPLVAARTPQAPPRPAPFFLPPVPTTPLLAFVPPPVPTPARPTPPSGTSAVTSPVEMAEHEEEQEEATESVSNQALAYSAPEHEPVPTYLLGIVLLAALAGASVGRRRRRDRRQLCVAPATLSSMRTQRNLTRRSRGGR